MLLLIDFKKYRSGENCVHHYATNNSINSHRIYVISYLFIKYNYKKSTQWGTSYFDVWNL